MKYVIDTSVEIKTFVLETDSDKAVRCARMRGTASINCLRPVCSRRKSVTPS
jgi:hypothetical protein